MKAGRRVATAGLFSRAGRFTSVAWVVAVLVSLSASRAWGNSAPLPVSFEGTGQALPQAEIRVAIATELGRQALAESGPSGDASENRERVVVAVDELGQLWIRYWGPRGLVDRHLPMPARPDQIPLVVSLSVGNLVRQEAFELLRDLERRRAEQAAATAVAAEPMPKKVAPAPTPPSSALAPQPALPKRRALPAPRTRVTRKNSWGHYLVGDFPYIPGVSSACNPGTLDPCYDRDFEPISYDVQGTGLASGLGASHGRYVMAYSRAFMPDLWGSLRVGFAFSGGNGKNAAAERDPALSKFMPWLFEVRLQHFLFQGAFGGALRPFVHVAAGVSEASAEVTIRAPPGPDGLPIDSLSEREPITMIHAIGLLHAGAGLGGSLVLFEPLRLEVELSAFIAFPSYGWLFRPSVGLAYDF